MLKTVTIVSVVVALGGLTWLLLDRDATQNRDADVTVQAELTNIVDTLSEKEKRARSAELRARASRSLRFDQSSAKLQNNPMDRSELSEAALLLDDPELSDQQAMEAIHGLLASLRVTVYRGDYPTGLNVEVTNSLLGDNPTKVGVLPGDSPRINENGELVDEHGTPYWIHSPSYAELTIRSAGADRILFTGDDLMYPDEVD
ncbi:hypothetical protein ACFPK9_13925 [Rubritalea spongiae]|uniref:Uncharacterized protein n=1 Tax=Rubritalea spongiae TaxID=430797 RepID=A0ABW5E0B6_9BACT